MDLFKNTNLIYPQSEDLLVNRFGKVPPLFARAKQDGLLSIDPMPDVVAGWGEVCGRGYRDLTRDVSDNHPCVRRGGLLIETRDWVRGRLVEKTGREVAGRFSEFSSRIGTSDGRLVHRVFHPSKCGRVCNP